MKSLNDANLGIYPYQGSMTILIREVWYTASGDRNAINTSSACYACGVRWWGRADSHGLDQGLWSLPSQIDTNPWWSTQAIECSGNIENMWTLFWGFKEVTEDGISQTGLTNRTNGMNNLQGISIVDGNFDQRGAGLWRLRCLSEITLVDLCPSVPAPAPHDWSAQGSWPQCISEGWVSRVMPVSQRLQLSFHSSCTSVFSEDLHNHFVNEKSKNCYFLLQTRNMKLGG